MRKPLKALFAAVLPVTLVFTASLAAGCAEDHEHDLTAVTAKEATCTAEGNTAYWHCDGCDKYFSDANAEHEIALEDTVIAALGHEYKTTWTTDETNHWHECVRGDSEQDKAAHADGNADGKCDICGYEMQSETPDVEYEDVTTSLDYETGYELYPSNSTEEIVLGRFTIEAGARFDSSTGGLDGKVLNNQQKMVSFTLQGITNSVSFDMKCASGSGMTMTLYKVEGETATVVKAWDTLGSNEVLTGCEVTDLEAGDYYLDSVGSARIANLAITERLAASDPASIEVSGGQTEFLAGDEFVSTGLNVTLVYENGRREALTAAQYQLDSSKYVAATAGTYEITVSYTPDGATEAFTDSYDVNVYAIDSIELYYHSLNSSRVTQNVQKVFFKGDTFNSDNLAVHATGKLPDSDKTVDFTLSSDDFEVSLPDMKTVGEKTVTVSSAAERGEVKTATYTINVLDNVFTAPKGSYTITVDADADVSATSAGVTLNSIVDALKYFELAGVPDAAAKVINVAPGAYNEKIEVNMPNVSITGTGESAEETVVEFDALNGLTDPSGTTSYSTDGSATISVRESATGFYAENITFSNYWNTYERYVESQTIAGSGTQAVAVLVDSDMATFKNVRFSSYQDTLYAMTGRQYYIDCYIEGRTDYVFGYNATAYFYNCELHTIWGNSQTNGGYVVASKGLDEGADVDAIEYGYIFDNCDFTAENTEGRQVTEGTVSLARGWDTEMKMMVMNSTISGAYSKEAYGEETVGGSNKNDRYGKMNADPVAEYLLEYNNTGDGAITQSIADTCTVVDATTAAKYADFATIFGTTNGKVTYAEAWDPTIVETPVEVTGVTLDKETLSLTVGEGTGTLEATVAPANATETRLVWYSSDEKVATVSGGVVTPVAEGTATITVVTVDGDYSATCAVTVKEPEGGLAVTQNLSYTSENEGDTASSSGTVISDDVLFTAEWSGKNGTVTKGFSTAVANDNSGRSFDYAMLPSGSGGTVAVTAKANLTLIVYYTSSDSKFTTADQTKSGNLTWTINGGEAQTGTEGNKDNKVAYAEVITLSANDVLLINISGNRLALFGLYATQS